LIVCVKDESLSKLTIITPAKTATICGVKLSSMKRNQGIDCLCQRRKPFKVDNSRHFVMSRFVFVTLLILSCRICGAFSVRGPGTRASLTSTAASVSISDSFDGGNIEYLGEDVGPDGPVVRLNIKKDPYTELEQTHHCQSFLFRSLCSNGEEEIQYVIENAGETSYAKALEESTVFFSRTIDDPYSWKRIVDTKYENGRLFWNQKGNGYFAYFPPYSYNRHLELIEKCGNKAFSLGKTLDGRDIGCDRFGTGDKICWIIHRQHPGENMAEYFAEGLLERLLGNEGSMDGLTSQVLQQYTFYIVPNMNLDGGVRGHIRTNAQGQNLNREWASTGDYEAPSLERSPEVYHVLRKMDETGVDVFFDVHGDEVLPYNFLAGSEGMPNWGPRLKSLHGAFLAAYERANSDMQRTYGYSPDAPGEGKVNICSNQIALRFDCLSATLEMPFKDCWTNPNPEVGWSPARAKQLGYSILDPLNYVDPYLRDETEFWKKLPTEDAYIAPTPNYR
jgi:murein tripeptide amidase MpaA